MVLFEMLSVHHIWNRPELGKYEHTDREILIAPARCLRRPEPRSFPTSLPGIREGVGGVH